MAGTHRDFNHLKRTAVRDFCALNHANQTVASVFAGNPDLERPEYASEKGILVAELLPDELQW